MLKIAYDSIEGKSEEVEVVVVESLLPKVVGSSRQKKATTLAAD